MVKTRTKSPEEVDGAKTPAAEATAIAVMITEIIWLQINIYSNAKWKTVRFQN